MTKTAEKLNVRLKNRGAISNPEGRFETEIREDFDDGWDSSAEDQDSLPTLETMIIPEYAKTVLTRNNSPDIGFEQSINPYRGCEHGCIYCYARPAHAYMNMSPGIDFETKIFYKVDAAKILATEMSKPSYICKPIMLGSNTDPYQPIESKLKVTRSIIELLNKHHHPVTIITKSSLIERDIELLADMARRKLAKVAISVTTLSNPLKMILEPRTATGQARLNAIKKLSDAGVPVRVMAAPMIPMINDMELEKILKAAKEAGARYASYVFIRLPYEVKILFQEWLQKHFPDRADHVMSIIRQMRGGKEYDSTFGQRMRGKGEFADLLEKRFDLACKRFKLNIDKSTILDTRSFKRPLPYSPQLELWDKIEKNN